MRSGAIAALLALAAGLISGTGPARAGTQTCAGEVATVVGTAGDDTLSGTAGRDVITGLGGDDVLTGEGGDDVLCGGSGDDLITAGAGADRLRGGRGDDEISDLVVGSASQELVGGPGADTLRIGWQVEEDGAEVPVTVLTDLAQGVVVVGETGVSFPLRSFRAVQSRFSSGTWAVVGTDDDEVFTAHQYMAVDARAGRGRDVVHGSWHDDHIHGGPGRDTAYPSRGRDSCRSVERGPLGECEDRS